MNVINARSDEKAVGVSTTDARTAWLYIGSSVLLAWTATYLAGGSRTALPHLFYVPIIITAARFGARWTLLVSLFGGVAAGPFMPLDVTAGIAQVPTNWAMRIVAFVVIGQVTAYLFRRSLPSLTAELADRRLRTELDEAIASGHLRLAYQPLVDLTTGGLVGVEALIRWHHPVRGPISPAEFIGEAERLGCIGEVTRFVIATACQQVGGWQRTLLAEHDEFKIAVNVSALDVGDQHLPHYVGDILRATGVPPSWLHLEITETALVRDTEAVVEQLMDLRMLGLRLSIDDFGVGESSLGHLHRFPVDTLKLDRMFLDRLEDEERGDVVARGVVALADALDLATVAEGIETPAQARIVQALGCDHGQGYLFSRPLAADALAALLADRAVFREANFRAMHVHGDEGPQVEIDLDAPDGSVDGSVGDVIRRQERG